MLSLWEYFTFMMHVSINNYGDAYNLIFGVMV